MKCAYSSAVLCAEHLGHKVRHDTRVSRELADVKPAEAVALSGKLY